MILLGGFFATSLFLVVVSSKFSSFLKNKLQLGEDYIPYIIISELVMNQIVKVNKEIEETNKKLYKIPNSNIRKMKMKIEAINQLIREYNNNTMLPKKEAKQILLEEIYKIEIEIKNEQTSMFFSNLKTPFKKEKSHSKG